MSDSYIYKLVRSIQQGNTILFVGAGISRNLGLPSYGELINQLSEDLGFDSEIYQILGNGDPLTLAEYYVLKQGSLVPLLEKFQNQWTVPIKEVKASRVHELIAKLNFPIIYTTNYDNGLELAFEEYSPNTHYHKIADVGDIACSNGCDTQIIKFHGDMETTDESSIVLTESSYFERLNFDSPLDIKFRSDILGKSILFLGYSLNDINIRLLLHKLNATWKIFHSSTVRPPSYMFLTSPNEIQETILRSRGIIPIVSKNPDPKEGTIEFLERVFEGTGKLNTKDRVSYFQIEGTIKK